MPYTIPNDWERAAERLGVLGAAYDAASRAAARQLGLRGGWECLEAGAGGGSFARWLCAQVLPGGRVLAVDLDPRHLHDLREHGGEVAKLDLVTDALPGQRFDFVHARLVLLHIAARERVLDKLVRALKPGGAILVEEHDAFGVIEEMSGAYGRVWPLFRRVGERGGLDATWARRLPQHLERRGLEEVAAAAEIPFFRGGSPLARLWQLTWLQNRPELLQLGATEELLDAATGELADAGNWFYCPPMIRATGRRPAAES